MRKITLFILLVIGMMTIKAQNTHFAGGTGTAEDPYQITEPVHLDNLRHYLGNNGVNKYFKLMNSLELSDYIALNYAGTGWVPIGSQANTLRFRGVLDGNCKVIRGLWIDRKINVEGNALFGSIEEPARIKNLGVETNCRKGIKSIGRCTGILVGCVTSGTIERCYTVGNVISTNYYTGGFVGYMWNGTVKNCFHIGNVTGKDYTGGFTSIFDRLPKIYNSYVVGKVTGSGDQIGAFVSRCGGALVDNCFYDRESNPSLLPTNYGDGSGIHGKTQSELKNSATFAGWDFNVVWDIDEGVDYPFLQCGICFKYGSGTEGDPYQIRTAEDFECFRNYLGNEGEGKYFKLMNHIKLEGEWEPIGTQAEPFRGTFDGNNFAITNISINKPNQDNIGFFGVLANANIKNLALINLSHGDDCDTPIRGNNNVGMLAGKVAGGVISKCFVYSVCPIEGTSNVGGLIGNNSAVAVTECSSRAILRGGLYHGGLIGLHQSGYVITNYSQNIIQGFGGGLIGKMEGGILKNAYFSGILYSNYAIVGTIGSGASIEKASCFYNNELPPSRIPSQSPHAIGIGNTCMKYRDCISANTGMTLYNNTFNFNPNVIPGCYGSYSIPSSSGWTAIAGYSFPFFIHEHNYMNMMYCFQLFLESGGTETPYDFPCYGEFDILNTRPYNTKSGIKSSYFEKETIIEEAANTSLYPNPTTGIVNIEGGNLDIKVYNVKGILLIETQSNKIDLSTYPSGVYIFNINGKMEKVVKQ